MAMPGLYTGPRDAISGLLACLAYALTHLPIALLLKTGQFLFLNEILHGPFQTENY